ncbi:Rha family transcriptional regulator [Pseudomonas protegens]|uniref:Rha family transcriptional regulator n=1 Tax=Pseudomonas protegens TaxID=380021 RepID=UPI002263E4B2|nr:Rha family transcriptional regulator [Pseudomonas protegens]
MNTNTVIDMRKFVEARNGEAFTTSQNVADAFGKLHKDVLRKVESLECSADFTERNFALSEYIDASGRRLPQWGMTKDGFMFLVMGFTGKKAAAIKEGYISAFNWMAVQLGLSSKTLVANAVTEALGAEGARTLSNVMRCRVAKLDAEHQRSATAKLASALHARFDVPRMELIPGNQLDAACNFVAAYAIEGEYLGKEESKAEQPLNIHFPVEALARRRPEMVKPRGDGHAWLDVSLNDLRDFQEGSTPCEAILDELHKAGYEIEGAWWELRTYRNKMQEIASFARGLTCVINEPHRYAIKTGDAA